MARITRLLKGSSLTASLVAMQFMAASAALAATGPGSAAAEPALEQLMELDEVRVQGKRKARDITAAEDAFFRLYNELNTDDRFDVQCGLASLREQSLIMVRTCVPGYVASALAEAERASNARFDCSTPRSVTRDATAGNVSGVPAPSQFAFEYVPPACITAFRAAPMAGTADMAHLRHRAEYARTVAAIVRGDARLQDMAAELALMYEQMEAVRVRFTERRALDPSARKARFEHAGPR